METLHFEISINADAEKVYRIMLDERSYADWTVEFNPTSHFVGSWEKGSKIVFLGSDKNGEMGGMVSRIRENILFKFISIEHLGIVQNGKEITSGKEIEAWAGALENYTFVKPTAGHCCPLIWMQTRNSKDISWKHGLKH